MHELVGCVRGEVLSLERRLGAAFRKNSEYVDERDVVALSAAIASYCLDA